MDNKRKNNSRKSEDFSFQVDLRGIIHLLSENLYSSQDVFLRELLQNAVDAIRARRAQDADFKEGRIQITYHREAKGQVRLVFSDNGIGLGREEMHTFLSVIGQSSKRGNVERTGFIGQFGIGLLSCFLVTDEILFQSRSVREAQGYQWLGKSDGTYQVTEDLRKPESAISQEIQPCAQPGTCVTLVLKDRMAERYGEEKVTTLLREYGFLLRVPVEFVGDGGIRQINDSFIPWRQSFCSGEQILEFGQRMFGEEFFGVVPVVGEGLKGYAFISSHQMSLASTGRHKIYLRDMLVTEDGKDLIPKWAFFTRCILNAQELTPMASREGFVSDHQLAKARNEIEKCIFNYFTDLARFDVKRLKQLTLIHNLAIKSLAVENEQVYKLFFPFLTFTTNKGKLTGFQIIEAAKKLPVYYCAEADDYRRATPLAGKDSLLINAAYNYDARLLQFLKRYYQKLRVEPFDGDSYGELLEEPSQAMERELGELLLLAGRALDSLRCQAVLKQFDPADVPALYVESEDGFWDDALGDGSSGRKFSDFMDGFGCEENGFENGFPGFMDSLGLGEFSGGYGNKLYLNGKNPLIIRLAQVRDEGVATDMVRVLYVQAMLAGHYTPGVQEMEILNTGLISLIEYGLGGNGL